MPKPSSKHHKGLKSLLGRQVVMDTAGSLTYLGTLREICREGYWLDNADIRDRHEGHDTKEEYICKARREGIRENRKSIFVFAQAVMSVSPLEAIVAY
jgi:hypothetical protein